MKVLASVARCQRTPPSVAKPKDLSFGLSRYIKQREQPEQSYRLQLEISPTRRNHHGQKTNLYTLVDPVSPPSKRLREKSLWWRRRVLPPGPKSLLR